MKKLRSSFRRKETYVPPASKPHQWQMDEKLVRAGTCVFAVKYLGSIEVNESRGMHICEEAAKHLRSTTRKKVRAVLCVGADGLRVTEDESKGLIVDQTIEKVSFCAPDRNHDKGFAYISRDGTTRRWLCHAFHSLKEPGERLSHAVGCAFAACLERKQQRDKLCGVKVEFDVNKTSFTRQGSFKQSTMTEQLEAQQQLEPLPLETDIDDLPESGAATTNPSAVQPFARPRRHASNDLLMRARSSFRGTGHQLSDQSPFKRQLSLRLNELPSTIQRQQQVLHTHQELSPIHSPTSPTVPEEIGQQPAEPTTPAQVPQPPNQPMVTQPSAVNQQGRAQFNMQANAAVPTQNGVTDPNAPTNIAAACQQLTNGLFELSSQGAATPNMPPQQPMQQQVTMVNGAVRPVQLGQQPIGQPNVPIQQAAVPPQLPPRTLQPTVAPIKQTNPWEQQTPSPPQPTTTSNPWATPTSSTTTTPTQQARLTEAEKWLVQTSQTVSPVSSLGSPSQQVQVQVHSGSNTPIQNGGLSHDQIQQQQLIYQQQQQQQMSVQQQRPSQQAMVASMNYNNANNAATVNMATQQQKQATQNKKGLSGTWTNDMSRTLPNANITNGNGNQKVDNFDAKWEALDGANQAPNPFKNAVKTFEINL
ncbi:uncharacterized protein [Amphiura filiformis]|uniref:uncharacterized protein n=1 Tax=Amphiura filiformis TaxID=82378 RepID=UPI003B20B9D9